jgi:hypothetical protein
VFVLCCTVETKAKARTVRRKEHVRKKYTVQENTKKHPGTGEIFRARPYRPWVSPSLLYNGSLAFFSVVKQPGLAVTPHVHLEPRLKKE